MAKSVRGWPKFLIEVWVADSEGKYSIGGYGTVTVPIEAGNHTIKVPCWRPKPQGYFKQLASWVLGIQPELKFKDVVMSQADRYGFECESTGTVEIQVGVITKDFNLHGVRLQEQ